MLESQLCKERADHDPTTASHTCDCEQPESGTPSANPTSLQSYLAVKYKLEAAAIAQMAYAALSNLCPPSLTTQGMV